MLDHRTMQAGAVGPVRLSSEPDDGHHSPVVTLSTHNDHWHHPPLNTNSFVLISYYCRGTSFPGQYCVMIQVSCYQMFYRDLETVMW